MEPTAPAAPAPRTASPPRRAMPGIFDRVFEKRTGSNGYEEFVLAGEAARESAALREALELRAKEHPLPLALKRKVFQDPPVVRALALLDAGLKKPAAAPRKQVDRNTVFPELLLFRDLSLLLALQAQTQVALGSVAGGIGSVRLGLRFGKAIQVERVHAATAGLNAGTRCLTALGAHLPQLGVRDCDQVYQLCLEWLRWPDPSLDRLEAERTFFRETVRALRAETKAKGLDPLLGQLGFSPDQRAALAGPAVSEDGRVAFGAEVTRLHAQSPQALDDLFAQAERLGERLGEQRFEQLKRPVWQRRSVFGELRRTPAGRLVHFLAPALEEQDEEEYGRALARVRLMACHARILQWRWDREKPPQALAALTLGDIAIDPFTGSLFSYTVTGRRYRLLSSGPRAKPGDPKAVNGRLPISVVPGE